MNVCLQLRYAISEPLGSPSNVSDWDAPRDDTRFPPERFATYNAASARYSICSSRSPAPPVRGTHREGDVLDVFLAIDARQPTLRNRRSNLLRRREPQTTRCRAAEQQTR